MQKVYFFFDDSGVLHKNSDSDYFVYAGYVFKNKIDLESAKRKYINANHKIKSALNRNDELKASNIKIKHKRALFQAVKEYDSVSAVANIRRIYDHILNDKRSICRYKDYMIKRCIKLKLRKMIQDGEINEDEDICIEIYIDEQLTATNGYYTLADSIKEELMYGIVGFNYSVYHQNLFDGDVIVNIQYCDSKKYYLIQASDILANRIYNSYKKNKPELREINRHISLTLP